MLRRKSVIQQGGLPRGDTEELSDATINVQSFVFNVFGALDNLAWIWMEEHGQKRADGTPIPDGHIGLGPKNTSVRATFSTDFQTYLATLDNGSTISPVSATRLRTASRSTSRHM
jgi:hypothetical protein